MAIADLRRALRQAEIRARKRAYGDRVLTYAELEEILMAHRFIDLTGQRFGKLVAIGNAGLFPQYRNTTMQGRRWMCRCDCGQTKVIRAAALRSGHIESCGCTRKGKNSERMKSLHYIARHLGEDALAGIAKAREMDQTGAILRHMMGQPPLPPPKGYRRVTFRLL